MIMSISQDHQMKVSFRKLFPEYAEKLECCTTQEELETLHAAFMLEATENLAQALGKDIAELTAADQTAPIVLTPETYDILINAQGDVIRTQMRVLIDGLERLKSMTKDDPTVVTLQMMLAGALGVGGLAIAAVKSKLIMSAGTALAVFTAAKFGVTTATVAAVCAVVALVIVAILIPLLYYINKPATCIVLLINELSKPLTFLDHHNVSGKPMLMTTPIPQATIIPELATYPTAGFIAAEKRGSALVGTQYGFVMKYEKHNLAFGVQNPLTGMYQDNNCYCAIGETAEQAARNTRAFNKQFWQASKDGINLSIRCNSGSGSIAYYIARAYKA